MPVESAPVTDPAFPVYPLSTLRELLFEAERRYGSRPALAEKREGVYQPISYTELRRQVEALGTALLEMGFNKGDRIAILSENRVGWAITYLAAVTSGMVAVPVDKELKEHDIRHILAFSGSRLLVTSEAYVRMGRDLAGDLKELQAVVTMDGGGPEADTGIDQLVALGIRRLNEGDRRWLERTVTPEDTAALIFTSGTTGASKAVLLSHGGIAANIVGVSSHVSIGRQDVLLSVLPLHHTYECTAGFLTALYQGAAVYYAEALRRIADNLRESRATVMLGVPALFENMYRRLEAGIQERGSRKFALAGGLARAGRWLGLDLRRRLFAPIHERFGGRLRLLISGGAAIHPEVAKGFRRLGIEFIQGYGMTEYSPIIAVNRVDCYRDGSVGLPLPGTAVGIIDGEIVVRGPCLMQGYYQNEAATREAIRDGRLFTGDLGYFDRDGFLHLSGRRKSVIVTPNGKNVYPEEIEAVLNDSPYILESLVWGGPDPDPARTEVQAIIVPDLAAFDREFGPLVFEDPRVREVIAAEVKRVNQSLAGYKRVKKFSLRREEFEKTTTRKVKRYLYTTCPAPHRVGR